MRISLNHMALTAIAFSVTLVASTAATAQDPLAGQSLFDGTTLTGWDGDPRYWRIEDGSIVGEIPRGTTLNKNTWLVWQSGMLKDFDLQLRVRLTGEPAANSGIQFRCQVDSVDHVSGYQADLDMGAVWLGRIYDEHGRALLVERGSRVHILPDGAVRSETFAPAGQYVVLFRENDWNDYRIVASGMHIRVFVNGTLFSELLDEQLDAVDLEGRLAFQLHSGPATRVEFRDIRLRELTSDASLLQPFSMAAQPVERTAEPGIIPVDDQGRALNLGFESGDLSDWTPEGTAFSKQPVNQDGISQRWPGQVSNKSGDYFLGGYEIVQDGGTGTMTSVPFTVTHPFGSFLIGGGQDTSTRVDVILIGRDNGQDEQVLMTASGKNREQMHRQAVDLQSVQGRMIRLRIVDENPGGWGHLNFDEFRFHDQPPADAEDPAGWRTTRNPVLQHLVPNPVDTPNEQLPGAQQDNQSAIRTIAGMFVPPGFSVDIIAAEPALHQPMAFAFDARGRLWVVEGHCYPQRRPEGEGLDRILILADTDHDGSFETRTVFMEGLNLASGLEVGYGGVWVGASPWLLFIPDADGDDRPDGPPVVMLDGFDYADTHETLNSFLWGPDGWLYGNHGVFNASLVGKPGTPPEQRQRLSAGVWRFHPTRHVFEVFAHGGSNQWGLDADDHGQLFMTHCRSYWGRGGTTHVMQGGHFWNQGNSGYAPFISTEAPPGMPHLKNYLLASARYDHGEGGAGKPGTDAVYGGHSHVGTMIYLGSNWPAEYRNHLFTHNLHGHQINHQINVREAGGYNTRHAGTDMFFCADRQYIGVDLQSGPDGAVYLSDWYDPRHCHNPDTEQWDRGNGRLYRLKYDATWKPVACDWTKAGDLELAEAQLSEDDWHVRTARRILSERASLRAVDATAIRRLREIAVAHPLDTRRLRAVWALHGIGALDADLLSKLLTDSSEFVRGWTVQLAAENPGSTQSAVEVHLVRMASEDPSLMVCRYLASAVQRVSETTGWKLAAALSARSELATDRDLPHLLWFGIARLMEHDIDHAIRIADATPVATIRDNILWYASKLSDHGRTLVLRRCLNANGDEQLAVLQLLELGVRGMRGLHVPAEWSGHAAEFYDARNPQIQAAAESIGASFGDPQLLQRLRHRIGNSVASVREKKQAISILAGHPLPENLPVLLSVLDDPELTDDIIPAIGRHNDVVVPEALLDRVPSLAEPARARAMEVLCSRVSWSGLLLDRIASGEIPASLLTAFYARQMASLGNSQLTERLQKEWGSLGQSSEEVRAEISRLSAAYKAAPLWAYDGGNGAKHFQKLCAQCHLPNPQSEAIAPRLAGSGARGVEYLVENIINPNAVIGRNYLARVLVTREGRAITGLIEQESDASVTIRTLNNSETVARSDIEEITTSTSSFMPEGLLRTLNDRERIELLKYLLTQ